MENIKIDEYQMLPHGYVMLFRGTEDSIPVRWVKCNGRNGTPNMEVNIPQHNNFLTKNIKGKGVKLVHNLESSCLISEDRKVPIFYVMSLGDTGMSEYFTNSKYHFITNIVNDRMVILENCKLKLIQHSTNAIIDMVEITSTLKERDFLFITHNSNAVIITYESIHNTIQTEYYSIINNKLVFVHVYCSSTQFVLNNSNTIIHNKCIINVPYFDGKEVSSSIDVITRRPTNLFDLSIDKKNNITTSDKVCGASIISHGSNILVMGGTNPDTGLRSNNDLIVITNDKATLKYKNVLRDVDLDIKDNFYKVGNYIYMFSDESSYKMELTGMSMKVTKHKSLGLSEIKSIITTNTEIYVWDGINVFTIVN